MEIKVVVDEALGQNNKLLTMLVIVASILYIIVVQEHFFQPIAYTLPEGLQSANGSNSTGGCPQSCVMMPMTGTTINGCDCPAPQIGQLKYVTSTYLRKKEFSN